MPRRRSPPSPRAFCSSRRPRAARPPPLGACHFCNACHVADKPEYRALFLSSVPETLDQVTAIANEHFRNPTVIYWEMGNTATKPEALEQIEATPYNVIVSYINGLILKRPHLDRARFGAVNIHPAPPEHGGAFGIWCQPVIRRDVRSPARRDGAEMDEDIDHGPLYEVKRWEVGEDATIQSVVDRTSDECLALCARMAGRLARSSDRIPLLPDHRRHVAPHKPASHGRGRREWFEALDPAHPAHQERVPFNHPRAVINPPYFDDLTPGAPAASH